MRLLYAKFIFDGEKLLNNCAVLIHKNKVIDIGAKKLLEKTYTLTSSDMGEGVLFPGFVNLHIHLELSHLKGKLPIHKGFIEWLKTIMTLKKEDFSKEEIELALVQAINELKQNGVFLVGDISNTLISCKYLQKEMPDSVVFFENYSLNKNGACQVKKQIPNILSNIKPQCKGITVSPSAHSVYSTHSCLIQYLTNFDKNLPYSMHFLETRYEKEFLRSKGELFEMLDGFGLVEEKPNYNNIFDYLSSIGALRKNTVFVHCVDADKNDMETIKKIEGTVCLCLRSNYYIQKQLPDVYMIEKSGVNIGIGTDSLASNWNLNFLDELKFIHKHFNKIDPKTIFRWASYGGAQSLKVNLGFKKGFMAKPFFLASKDNNPLEKILTN